MKERPILFSGPMVRAILDGQKTQTRRAVKPQPFYCSLLPNPIFPKNERERAEQSGLIWPNVKEEILERCQYGKVGDRLYVREDYYQYGHWEPVEGVKTKGGKQKWKFVPDSEDILFTEPPTEFLKARWRASPYYSRWYKRLGRFMPRKYSRITLEVTDIRVERLNQISERDAIAEGVPKAWQYADTYLTPAGDFACAEVAFQRLWESINGTGSWQANPWVWVIEFKRVA